MPGINLLSRRTEFFLKFFSEDSKRCFFEEVRKINKPGGFVKVTVTVKNVPCSKEKYVEVCKMPQEISTIEHMVMSCHLEAIARKEESKFWEELIIKSQNLTDTCFSWRAIECMYAAPSKKCVTA